MFSLTQRSGLRLLKCAGKDGTNACLCSGQPVSCPGTTQVFTASWPWVISSLFPADFLGSAFSAAFQEPLSVNAMAAGGLNILPGRWGHVRAVPWRSTKQFYTQVKLGLFHMALEMLVSCATKPALKANSFCFSLLSLVAH